VNVLVDIPKVWELLKRFKDRCQSKGWKIYEYEDFVNVEGEYHNFLWIRSLQPSTFEKIATNPKCILRKGLFYEVVGAAYNAWLFQQSPKDMLMQIMAENFELARQNAIYDLSHACKNKLVCWKLNKTDSIVFREFEKFLEDNLGVKLKSISEFQREQVEPECSGNCDQFPGLRSQ
jgi:hypothetical protein